MTEKTKHLGRESGKSSSRWFRNSNTGAGTSAHPKGYGASAGDGRTTDKTVAGKIVPTFRSQTGRVIKKK
jgi:hypothetical protein